jgi:hypothetical protein
MSKILSIGFLLAYTLILPASTFAQEGCTVVYGGGQVDCANITPVVASPTPTTAPPVNQTKSKGGLPIQPKTDVKTTPATGPETLALISLLPMAAAGFYLRNKTKGS